MNIAIIPARGGSKRIPRKNIKLFNGRPMIAWSIDAAISCELFDRVVVSTDDQEITNIAREYRADVPFQRPSELADDYTPTKPVVAHAVRWGISQGWDVKAACCIYPCAPLLRIADLASAFSIMKERNAEFVYPVAAFPHPVQRAMRMSETGRMEFINPEAELKRTQELETAYHDAGQFYWGTVTAWLGSGPMHSSGHGMSIPSWRVADIDNEEDWVRAELLTRAFGGEKSGDDKHGR